MERDAAAMLAEVTGGAVRGTVIRGLRMWRGIPYAAAPIGDLRYRAPQPVPPWSGVRSAAAFGPIAPQDRNGPFRVRTNAPMSEDCLSLNVIAPADPATRRAPVMVYIHGGAYSVGSSREIHAQGEGLVREGGVVFVNLNYRLGALGWLDFSSLSTRRRRFESNLGLRDQVAALEWVRDNIAAFGGDPRNVTLFGESAGGTSVTTLMTVPAAEGLFARAIAQSAPANAIYPPEVTALWAREFGELLSEVIDDSATESTSPELLAELLVRAPVEALVLATTRLQLRMPDRFPGTVALSPVIDGEFVPERPLDAFKHGRAHRVPIVIGTNAREGSLFRGRLDILATTPARIRAIFANTRKRSRKALKAQYPGLPEPVAARDFGGDFAFWFPSVKVAERHSAFAPVHMYRFDAAPRLLRWLGFGATHGLELFALFDRMGGFFGRGLGIVGGRRSFIRTGQRMRAHWLRFAHGVDLRPQWPRYTARHRRTLLFDRVDRIAEDPGAERRTAWQAFVPHV